MRQQIGTVDRLVDQAVANGDFDSKDECVSALLNWLVLNDYVNPSRLCNSEGDRDDNGDSIDERSVQGVSEAEETLLQYEILRDRDA